MQVKNVALSTAFVAAAISQAAPTFEKEHSLSSSKREPLNPAFLGGSILGSLFSGGSKEQQDAIAQVIPQIQGANRPTGEFPHLPEIKQDGTATNGTSSIKTNGTHPITQPILPQVQDAAQSQTQDESQSSKRQFLTNPAYQGQPPINPNAGHHPILPKRQSQDINDYLRHFKFPFPVDTVSGFTQNKRADEFEVYLKNHILNQYATTKRGSKTDIGGLVAAGLNLLHTLTPPQSRDFDDSEINEMVARGGKVTAGGAAALINILNPIISSLSPQSRGFDESEIDELIARGSKPTAGGAAALINIFNPIISTLMPQQRGLNEDEAAEILARDMSASIDLGKLLNLDVSARSDQDILA